MCVSFTKCYNDIPDEFLQTRENKNEHINKLNGDLVTQENPGSAYADFVVFVKGEMTK